MAFTKDKKEKVLRVLSDEALAKKYPGSGYANDILVIPEDRLWLPSRNLELNYTLGGGIPYGCILELFGNESSGKTLLGLDFGYVTQTLGGVILWNDAEQSFTYDWAIKNGLDPTKIIIYNSTSIEKVSDWARDNILRWRKQLVKNEPILLVTDSLAAIDCEANINSSQIDKKAEMGNRAKAVYSYLRTRNELFASLGVVSIFINQLREKVGATKWEDPDTTPAGNAMKFYAHQRVGVYGGKYLEEGINGSDEYVGRWVTIRIKKNKVAPPRKSFKGHMYFNPDFCDVGLDKYFGLPELFVKLGILERRKGASWYRYKDKNIANGEDAMLEKLKEDDELRSLLIRKSGINTISKTRKKLERIDTNKYPVKLKAIKEANEERSDKV